MSFLVVVVVAFLLLVAVALAGRVMGAPRSTASRGDVGAVPKPSGLDEPKPSQLDENVQFTVHSPYEIRSETWYPMLVFAHLSGPRSSDPMAPDPVEEMRSQATRILHERAPDYRAVTQNAAEAVPREGMLTFVPTADGVEFNPPQRSFRWEQDLHREEFQFRAAAGNVPRTARGRLTVFLGRLIIADVVLALRVSDASSPASAAVGPTQAATGQVYQRIFASYSRADTHLVEEFERFVETLGHHYLRDVRDIRSGEVWSARLEELIRTADIFQLFWSNSSMRSPFVTQEWEYALRLNRPQFIRPVYWESPFPETAALPPPSLKQLGFHKLGLDRRREFPALPKQSGSPWFVPLAAILVIGLVSAIAIPGLLRARLASNEASAIGRLRTMGAAQMAFADMNDGLYADPGCLREPTTCLPGHEGPPYWPPTEVEGVHAGYLFEFFGYPERPQSGDRKPSYSRWAYTAVPVNPELTDKRTFCADDTSRLCQWADGQKPRVIDGQCVCEPDGTQLDR